MWSIEFLDKIVFDEMQNQPNDIKAKFEHVVKLIQANGLERVHEPYIKHLEGKLWEMRIKGRDTIARAIYVTAVEKRIVVVRVFTKKKQKTPRREIEIALERAKEML
jgi:phage-related protein